MISFLITHYNRPKSLQKCIESIHIHAKGLQYEIVVSDDYSAPNVIEELKKMSGIELVFAKKNQGLASNINKGLKQCKGNLIVYIQEDFCLTDFFSEYYHDLSELLLSNTLDMIRFRSNVQFPIRHKLTDKIFRIPRFNVKNFIVNQYRYSDHPYIVKSDFYKKFGYYKEGVNTSYGENEYVVRMMAMNPNIGLTSTFLVRENNIEGTVREENLNREKQNVSSLVKKTKRWLLACRYLFEAVIYNKSTRKLKTFKNLRA